MTSRRRCARPTRLSPEITAFDASCFDGNYLTGDITPYYLNAIEALRGGGNANKLSDDDQLELELDLAGNAASM